MKTQLALLSTCIILIIGCSVNKSNQSYKQDPLDALNDFLETQLVDKDEEIIIIKERSNSDEAIMIFKGDSLEFSDSEGKVRLEKPIREGGVDFPLYNQKEWVKMKNKAKEDNLLSNNSYWNEIDFKHKSFTFISRKNIEIIRVEIIAIFIPMKEQIV